ncbi:MAG: prepilin peptidase [Rhodospirillales bacterium]|nr:prepilin peptidase [Rhodospirillales bacterium]
MSFERAALALLLGLVFGSFVTALVHRVPRGMALLGDRSRCPACGHVLGWRDLVPLLSWLTSRGRCRHCGQTISFRYPMIEIASALLVLLVAARQAEPLAAALLALMAVLLLAIALIDLEKRIIPNRLLLALLPIGLAYRLTVDADPLDMLGGLALALALGLGLAFGYAKLRGRPGLGMGDVKFLALAGLVLGFSGFPVFLLLAGLLGVVTGLGWRLAGRGSRFPFGPALAATLLIVLLFPSLSRL